MALKGNDYKDFSIVYPERVSQIPKSDLRIQYVMDAKHYANGIPVSVSLETKRRYVASLEKVLAEQHMFNQIGPAVADPDWSIKIDIQENEIINDLNVLVSGFSFMLIPAKETIEIDTTATVFNKDGRQLATLKANQNADVYYHLFFLFPWNMGLLDEIQQNLLKDIVLQLGELASQKGEKL
jgi:hypothetical protein